MNQEQHSVHSPLVPQKYKQTNLRDYVLVLWRRMWLIVLALMVLFCTVLVQTLRMKPVYQASAMLEIQRTGGGGAMSLEKLFSESLAAGSTQELNTEVEILKSRPVAEDAVRLSGHQLVLDKAELIFHTLLNSLMTRFKHLMDKAESEQRVLEPALVQEVPEPFRVEALEIPSLTHSYAFKVIFAEDASFRILLRWS